MLNCQNNRLRSVLATSAFLGLVFVAACEGNIPKANKASTERISTLAGTLQPTGFRTMAPRMITVAQRFQDMHPKVRIKVAMGGSGRGISDARSGNADTGIASREMTDKEKDLFGIPIARDGIGVLINQHNPHINLSGQKLLGLYAGEIRNWGKVGGDHAAITVISRDEGRRVTELFTRHLKIKHAEIQAYEVRGDNSEAISAVEADLQTIALMSIVAGEKSLKTGAKIKFPSLDGVASTSQNVITADYPLARPLTLVSKALPVGVVKEFIKFALSSQTVDIIREIGFVPYRD